LVQTILSSCISVYSSLRSDEQHKHPYHTFATQVVQQNPLTTTWNWCVCFDEEKKQKQKKQKKKFPL